MILSFIQQYWSILKSSYRYIGYGIAHSFFSSYGQTFFISLFLPFLIKKFQINAASFGSLYAIATLCSACLLPLIGRKVDTANLKVYSLLISSGLFAAILCISLSNSIVTVAISIVGFRLFGQSLLSHLYQTVISRFFIQTRGRVLSLASLGHAFGEAILPISVVTLIDIISWQQTWVLVGLVGYIILLLTNFFLIPSQDPFFHSPHLNKSTPPQISENEQSSQKHWTLKEARRDPFFYLIIPSFLSTPFILTGLFFYQSNLATFKGWDLLYFAQGFIAFASLRVLTGFLIGFLIDYLTAFRIFIWKGIPLVIGLLLILFFNHPLVIILYLGFAGISVGLNSQLKSTLLTEVYGAQFLGSIKSIYFMLMVLSTACATWFFGLCLHSDIPFNIIISNCIILTIISSIFTLTAYFVKKKSLINTHS